MEYQRTTGNKYVLPTTVYNRTVWVIRDYYRMCEELHDIATGTPDREDTAVQKGKNASEVDAKAIARERMRDQVVLIEESLANIPEEYQKGVWENITERKAFPRDAARGTYARYKSKMIYEVAKKSGLFQE